MRGSAARLALLAFVALAAGCGRGGAGPERVVLVTIDTLRADRVGAYGHARARTPTLDGLAARGVRFETAVAPTPLTLPSHATLLTGLDPPRHGVRHNSVFRLDASIPTLAEHFTAAGWDTAAVVGAVVLERRHGLERGFAHYDDEIGGEQSGFVGYSERSADQVVERALAWLAEAPRRFFLWVHFYDPHAVYRPPPPFAADFRGAPYDGEIAFVDRELGRLLQALDGPRTLVVVTSDHGESLGEHGEPTHSYTLYEATQRVPLLLAGAGLPAGAVVAQPVALADVAPTLAALAGLAALGSLDGRDLTPLLTGGTLPERAAHLETLATQLDFGWSPLLGLRTVRFKYVRAPRPELYDLAADPAEERNLAGEDAARLHELEARLEARLAEATAPPAELLALSDAERQRLEALGYVVPAVLPPREELGRVGGPDPKDELGLIVELGQAEALVAAGRAAEALARLAEIRDPGAQVLALRAVAALRAGDPAAARRDAREALAQAPGRIDATLTLGVALEALGEREEARAVYRQAVVLAPRSAAARLGLGRSEEALGDRDAAAPHYEQARSLPDGGAEAVWRLAALRLEQGRAAEADPLLEGLTIEAQLEPAAALRLALAEENAGRGAKAGVRLREARRRHPDAPALALAQASLLEKHGQLEEALRVREEALARTPDVAALENAVAWTLLRLGRDLDRALGLAQAAARRSGDEPNVLDTLAELHLVRGEPAAALSAADRALAVGSASARLLYLRAAALAALGRPAQARRALERSLALREDEAPAPWLAERQRLAQRLGVALP